MIYKLISGHPVFLASSFEFESVGSSAILWINFLSDVVMVFFALEILCHSLVGDSAA